MQCSVIPRNTRDLGSCLRQHSSQYEQKPRSLTSFTSAETKRDTHGLNGDILVRNHVTERRHELSSMGIRVNAETLRKQLEMSKLLDNLKYPYQQAIINNQIPLSIGGGIGQSRTLMLLLRKAHLGEVSVTVWQETLKEMCAKKNIFVLE